MPPIYEVPSNVKKQMVAEQSNVVRIITRSEGRVTLVMKLFLFV